jgi:alkylhydroperoxidase/carboxymuconolactone decarboxylase family protein YurZ
MDETAVEHFNRTLETIPEPIAVLVDEMPELLDAYVEFRKIVMTDRDDGLDLPTKELLFVVLDVAFDNEPGAMNHLRAALKAGVTPTQLLEALLEVWIVGGIQTWGKSGHRVFRAALEHARAQGAS